MITDSRKTNHTNRHFSHRAGLHYVNDNDPGIQRARVKNKFRYLNTRGVPIRDERVLARIARLAIPPAWEKVWICKDPKGHIQAVGFDVRGRKQYRYHERWSELRSENKFDRMLDFGRALPRIRQTVARDLREPQLTRRKVLAAVVQLLETSAARIGNEQYVQQNGSYGLSTLRNRHARVAGDTIHLKFRGKTGKEHEMDVRHPTLARIIRKCQHLPGQRLFGYVDQDGVHSIASDDINAYIHEIGGEDFSTKDFRTWKATTLAMSFLSREEPENTAAKNRLVRQAIQKVARHLGNTAAICKKSYIHPSVLQHYLSNAFPAFQRICARLGNTGRRLRSEEQAVLRLLRGQAAGTPRKPNGEHLRPS